MFTEYEIPSKAELCMYGVCIISGIQEDSVVPHNKYLTHTWYNISGAEILNRLAMIDHLCL